MQGSDARELGRPTPRVVNQVRSQFENNARDTKWIYSVNLDR